MFKVLDKVCEPQRATEYSAYVDLFAREEIVINPGETKIVPLGVIIDLEKLEANIKDSYGFDLDDFMSSQYLEVAIRSSLSAKYGLVIANGSGKVDLDYPKEIGIIIHNPLKPLDKHALEPNFLIKKGDKVAQCTLVPHNGMFMGYSSKVKRTGGFGSTGK